MQFSFISLCLVLAIFSLVIVSIYVWIQSDQNRSSAQFLSAFLLANSLTLGNFLYVSSELILSAPGFGFIGNTLGLCAAPLLFLYTKSLADSAFRYRPVTLLHFSPVVLFLVIIFIGYTAKSAEVQLKILTEPTFPSLINLAVLPAAIFAYVFFYLGRTVRVLVQHRSRFRDFYANSELSDLAWLRISVFGAIAVWSFSLIHQLVIVIWPVVWIDRVFTTLMAGAAFVFGLYFLFQALRQSGATPRPLPTPGLDPKKYGDHRLSDGQMREFARALEAHFDGAKTYLDPSLSLDDLAAALPMTSRELSQTINRHYGRTFFDLVNDYRVRYAQTRLIADSQTPITEIMTASGFSSKSSFYSAFKKATSQTPSQYRATRRSATAAVDDP